MALGVAAFFIKLCNLGRVSALAIAALLSSGVASASTLSVHDLSGFSGSDVAGTKSIQHTRPPPVVVWDDRKWKKEASWFLTTDPKFTAGWNVLLLTARDLGWTPADEVKRPGFWTPMAAFAIVLTSLLMTPLSNSARSRPNRRVTFPYTWKTYRHRSGAWFRWRRPAARNVYRPRAKPAKRLTRL